ncbi:hypothetical protein C8R47DRAFT_1165259 [Mycena vitilis]|nr:hypothetical protein C8R47DRAFT_1165259 [Mycena vitilis]
MPLPLADLLNPSDAAGQRVQAQMQAGLVDIQPQLDALSAFSGHGARATIDIQHQLLYAIAYLEENGPLSLRPASPPPEPPRRAPTPQEETTSESKVKLNKKTTLGTLYRYPIHTVLEYPETSSTSPIGHLFRMDPDDWQVPDLNIAYSRGEPMGMTMVGKDVFVDIMVDAGGARVPCSERHSTCQGAKICPFSDEDCLSKGHTRASLARIQTRLRNDREERLQYASPTKDIFCRTAAYLSAIRKLGCSRPLEDITLLTPDEEERRLTLDLYWKQVQRGYRPKEASCEGRMILRHDSHGGSHVQCEHYNKQSSRDHFHDDSVGTATGTYDLKYIEAVLTDDMDEVARIEEACLALGYGPLVDCTTVTNASSQRAICPHDHRDEDGYLLQPLMQRLKCSVKFRVFEPHNEYRTICPYILITSSGRHTHPIPLPTRTPPTIRTQILRLLEDLGEDIPDITPRRFLRHPIVKTFLANKFPHIPHPTLSHLHVSLANRSHIKAYIKQIKEIHCPSGTGWEAIERLKALQDAQLPPSEHYIRRIIVIDNDDVARHEEDEDEPPSKDSKLRIIVCMSPIASRRILDLGRYLQSDIAFKRIVDFLEFEMACMDRDGNTSLIFCRVFLNRQTAVAHQHVFTAIHDIIYEDTGRHLRWRHLHASNVGDFDGMVLEWAADQHRGQAKGLGLYLQALAAAMPVRADLHEPHRTIQSLSPYDHLQRVFRLCETHFYRNITSCAVPPSVKSLMRSLLCLEHPNWDGTLAAIEEKGGKAGSDWVKDKQSTHFAFAAICWERSFIPKVVWMAGDSNTNLIESVHRDVNREGVHCTLLGGLQKGQSFDALKMRTLEITETYGIKGTYFSGHISENAFVNLRRRDNAQRRQLLSADRKIESINDKLQKSYDVLCKIRHNIVQRITTNLANHDISVAIARLTEQAERTLTNHLKLVEEGQEWIGKGSGHISLLVFDLDPNA